MGAEFLTAWPVTNYRVLYEARIVVVSKNSADMEWLEKELDYFVKKMSGSSVRNLIRSAWP
jgi:hypothetical protein